MARIQRQKPSEKSKKIREKELEGNLFTGSMLNFAGMPFWGKKTFSVLQKGTAKTSIDTNPDVKRPPGFEKTRLKTIHLPHIDRSALLLRHAVPVADKRNGIVGIQHANAHVTAITYR